MIDNPVEQALRLDASCVVVNLFRIPEQPEVTDQCIQNILKIKPECDRWSMPLMIEPLVFQANQKAGGYMVDGDLEKILPLVRQAVELGADIIKADPTDDVRCLQIRLWKFLVASQSWFAEEARRRTRKSSNAPKN